MASGSIRVQHIGGGAAEELSLKLVGFKELEARLKAMPRKIENKCLRQALRKAATKVAKRLRAGTPVGATGRAKKSVKVKVRVRGAASFSGANFSSTRGAQAYAVVKYTRLGWSGGFRGTKDPGPPFYMRLYEQGGSRQQARPYMSAALGNWQADANADFIDALKAAVEREEG